jgi:CoA:oxalate CoA-transferase
MGNEHPFAKPYEQFPGRDGFVFFGGYTDKFWSLSCRLFGDPEDADDPDTDTMAKRFDPVTYESKVKPVVLRWFADRTKAELEAIAGDDVPLSAVKTIAEVVEDPQIAARDMIVEVAHPRHGPLRMVGSPIKLGLTPTQPRGSAPDVGEHTTAVLGSLGLDGAAVDALREKGVV